MKKSRVILFMMLLVVFAILYTYIDTSDPLIDPNIKDTTSESIPQKDLENLKKYQERFARNSYHLEKAIKSINELKSMHDSLNDESIGNAAIKLKILHHRSLIHLEAILESVKKYEEYPNLMEHDLLEKAIKELEKIDHEIIVDSLNQKDIYHAFDFAINALAKAELNITESAMKSNQPELAKLALMQAQVHVKNAFLLDYSLQYDDGKHFDMEVNVFKELDSLIENESITIPEMDERLRKISKELEHLMAMAENDKMNK